MNDLDVVARDRVVHVEEATVSVVGGERQPEQALLVAALGVDQAADVEERLGLAAAAAHQHHLAGALNDEQSARITGGSGDAHRLVKACDLHQAHRCPGVGGRRRRRV